MPSSPHPCRRIGRSPNRGKRMGCKSCLSFSECEKNPASQKAIHLCIFQNHIQNRFRGLLPGWPRGHRSDAAPAKRRSPPCRSRYRQARWAALSHRRPGPGEACHADADVGPHSLACTARHLMCRLARDRCIHAQRVLADAEQSMLHTVRIRDNAAHVYLRSCRERPSAACRSARPCRIPQLQASCPVRAADVRPQTADSGS